MSLARLSTSAVVLALRGASGSGSGSFPSISTGGGPNNPNAPHKSSLLRLLLSLLPPARNLYQRLSRRFTPCRGLLPRRALIYPFPISTHLSWGGSSTPCGSGVYNFTAKFNVRTGAFARPDGRDQRHLSGYEHMKRMSSVYFSMEQWEQEVAQRKN